MSRFKRLPTERKKQQLEKQYEMAAKRQRNKLMLEIKRRLGMKGTLTKKMNSFVYHSAKIIEAEKLEDQLTELLAVCHEVMPRINTCPWQARAMHFFYFLRDNRFDKVDIIVRDAYMEMVHHYKPGVTLPTKEFLGLGSYLLKRLREWVGPDAGNTDEDMLVDYLSLVVNHMGTNNPKWILRPSQLLGDLGWTIFMEQMEEKHGGLSGYRKSNSKQLETNQHMQTIIERLTKFKLECINNGDLTPYDELEKKISMLSDDKKIEKLIDEYTHG